MTLIKSISGIRGTIGGAQGDNLTPIDIVKFTTAYVRFMSEKNGRQSASPSSWAATPAYREPWSTT